MAKFNYYLREPKAKTPTPIILTIVWQGQRLKYPTKQTIAPKYWDNELKMIPDKKLTLEVKELRRKLENDLIRAKNVFTQFEIDNKRTPTGKELKSALDKEFTGVDNSKTDTDFLNYIEKFINESDSRTNERTGKPIAKGTIQTYRQIQSSVQSFCKTKRRKLTFEDIDLDFYFDFNKHLIKQGLSTNTIGKRIALLITILKDATERGINKNLAYQSKRFKVIREKTDNIYLNESELMEIFKLDLSNKKRLDNVRDSFLIGCWTALRWSDISRLSDKDIKDNKIEIEAQKTREKVVIPVHPIVTRIITKHDGKLPRALSNQKMNKYLKELGQMVDSLHEDSFKKITKGGQEITKRMKKFERNSTHTARRSFASNLFLDGIPAQTIMKITGHKSEKSFMQYIKISPEENANIVQLHWDKKFNLKVL